MLELNKIYNEDCLIGLSKVPDKSINLIVIDPPYNIGKDYWDKIDNYIEWMGKVFKECQRVLKDNGSFYWFHNDFIQMSELQHWLKQNTGFKFKQLITLNKTRYKKYAWTNRDPDKCFDRNWFPNIEYLLFYTLQEDTGLETATIRTNYNDIINKIQESIKLSSISKNEIIQLFLNEGRYTSEASAKVHASYKMGWNKGKRFDLMDEELFNYLSNKIRWQFTYNELRNEYDKTRKQYEDMRYVFNLEQVKDNISCVWEWSEGNTGKIHPTQKPIDILEKIIKTSSNEGDTILDCFMGSGSTAIACINTDRNYMCFELDKNYYSLASTRIQDHIKNLKSAS
jgi:DNA modification methylase